MPTPPPPGPATTLKHVKSQISEPRLGGWTSDALFEPEIKCVTCYTSSSFGSVSFFRPVFFGGIVTVKAWLTILEHRKRAYRHRMISGKIHRKKGIWIFELGFFCINIQFFFWEWRQLVSNGASSKSSTEKSVKSWTWKKHRNCLCCSLWRSDMSKLLCNRKRPQHCFEIGRCRPG